MSVDPEGARKHSVRQVEIRRVVDAAEASSTADVVAAEEPLGIRLGYSRPDGSRAEEDVSITMRTPGYDADLAVGFLFTEGIIHSHSEVQGVVPRGQPDLNGLINSVRVDLVPGVEVDFKRLERHFYTSSSCGVCGKASLDLVAVQGRFDLHGATFKIAAETLGKLPALLASRQAVFEQTGGLHASGLFDSNGDIVATLESQLGETLKFLRSIPESKLDYRYAPGKWNIKEIVGHLGDGGRASRHRSGELHLIVVGESGSRA